MATVKVLSIASAVVGLLLLGSIIGYSGEDLIPEVPKPDAGMCGVTKEAYTDVPGSGAFVDIDVEITWSDNSVWIGIIDVQTYESLQKLGGNSEGEIVSCDSDISYVAGGPSDDHEGVAEDDAVARVRQGMRSMLRLGSAWYDVERQITAVTEKGLDPRNFILCTDDCHSGTLVNEGHMNRVVRHAIDCGCDPLVAIQMATINTASHFGMERELGSITPGRRADFIVTSSLRELPIESVFARGQCIAEHGKLRTDCPHSPWPSTVREPVK